MPLRCQRAAQGLLVVTPAENHSHGRHFVQARALTGLMALFVQRNSLLLKAL